MLCYLRQERGNKRGKKLTKTETRHVERGKTSSQDETLARCSLNGRLSRARLKKKKNGQGVDNYSECERARRYYPTLSPKTVLSDAWRCAAGVRSRRSGHVKGITKLMTR